MAAGPLPAVRRGRRVLGARRDRQGPGRHPRDRRRRRRRRPSSRGRRRPASPTSGRRAGSSATAPALGLGGAGERAATARRRSPPGGGSSRRWPTQAPAVLVFEDLHWADDGAARLRRPPRRLGARRAAARRLHGAAGAARAAAGLGRRQAQRARRCRCAALRRRDGAARRAPARARRARRPRCRPRCSSGAGGNPLYAEEYVRMLADRGRRPTPLPLPDTVQGIIAARLDALPPRRRRCCRTRR